MKSEWQLIESAGLQTVIDSLKAENAALRTSITQSLVYCTMKERLERENAALREEVEEAQRVVIETRLASVNGMNEIRSALGLPLGHEDKSGKRVLDYVRELKDENDELRERLDQAATNEGKLRRENTRLLEAILNAPKAVCEELDRRAATGKEAQP